MENRTERITLKVTPQMMERIDAIGERMQINSTSLCATWIAEKVDAIERQTRVQESALEKFADRVIESIDAAEFNPDLSEMQKKFEEQMKK